MSVPLGLKNNMVKTNSQTCSSTFPILKHTRNQSLRCLRQEISQQENSKKKYVPTKRPVSAVNLNANNKTTDMATPIRIPQALRTQIDIKPQAKTTKMETPVQVIKKNVSVTTCKRSAKSTSSPIKKSVSKNSAKKQRTAHAGVPIPEKMRKAFALMQKELNLNL